MNPHRWRVLHVDLAEELPVLRSEPGYAGCWAIFFRSGLPLGHAQIPSADLPLAAEHLAVLAARVTALAAGDRLFEEGFRAALPGLLPAGAADPARALRWLVSLDRPLHRIPPPPDVSGLSIDVAICTRERPAALDRCLRSILRSTVRPRRIIVIDNAPATTATRELAATFPDVRYHCEPRPGLSHARNTAMALAESPIVAFADDDVTVEPAWLDRLRSAFSSDRVMVATGLVLPGEIETEAQYLFEKHFQYFHHGYRRRIFDSAYFEALKCKGVPVWKIGAGANMAIRRKAYELGFAFDTRLGPGIFGGCGEDSEFWYRLLAAGWTCVYEPAAAVSHFHRRDDAALRALQHQYMKGHVAALIRQFARHRHTGNLRRLLLHLPAEYALLLLRSVSTGFSKDCRLLLRGGLGCLSGLRFAFRKS